MAQALVLVQGTVQRPPLVCEAVAGPRFVHTSHHRLPRHGGPQLSVAFRQVARFLQHSPSPLKHCLRDIQCRWCKDRQILQREPQSGEIRGCESCVLDRPCRHRGRAFLQPLRHRPLRSGRRLERRHCSPPAPRCLDDYAAVGQEHVPRAHPVLHRSAGQDTWHQHCGEEEQGMGDSHQVGDCVHEAGDPDDVCQHGRLRFQLFRHQDRLQHLLQHHA